MNKNYRREEKAPDSNEDIRKALIDYLDTHPDTAFSQKQLEKKLKLKDIKSRSALETLLDKLEKNGKLQVNRKRRKVYYQSSLQPEDLEGRVDHVSPNHAYIVNRERPDDVMVYSENLNGALHGDLVRVKAFPPKKNKSRAEGKVMEIIARKKGDYVGLVSQRHPRYTFVIADNRKIYVDFFIRNEDLNGAEEGDKVTLEMVKWDESDKNPIGRVKSILGKAGDNEAEMHAILTEYGLPVSFPESLEKEAENLPSAIPAKEIKKRRDFRDVTTFTIDPEEAKDFDDGLSIRKLENGNWEVGVHIADVSYYVKPGSKIDKEAYERATSVYLVDRVVPMLPEQLSNFLCSLRPNEDRLAFASVFELDETGKVYNSWFGRTVIHSNRRFTYEDAQALIENGEGEYAEEVRLLNSIALNMRRKRIESGALDFEDSEVKFQLDKHGKPLAVVPKDRKEAHKMIEEFMLLANKKVAEFVYNYKKGKEKNPMVYRIHDPPDIEKLKAFSVFAGKFGHKINPEDKNIAPAINQLMKKIEGQPEQDVLQILAIRSMAKARYATQATGHFGLHFTHYTHFTSPIRRYPDLMVHRLLQMYLDDSIKAKKAQLEDQCKYCSEMEALATEAERASIKYKQVEFIENMIGHEFEGVVSGITDFGIFVELTQNKCEGLVRLHDMEDDYYQVDLDNLRIIGKKLKRTISFGDKVEVKVKDTNLEKRTIDLILL